MSLKYIKSDLNYAKKSHYFQNIGIISDPIRNSGISTCTWKRVLYGQYLNIAEPPVTTLLS